MWFINNDIHTPYMEWIVGVVSYFLSEQVKTIKLKFWNILKIYFNIPRCVQKVLAVSRIYTLFHLTKTKGQIFPLFQKS